MRLRAVHPQSGRQEKSQSKTCFLPPLLSLLCLPGAGSLMQCVGKGQAPAQLVPAPAVPAWPWSERERGKHYISSSHLGLIWQASYLLPRPENNGAKNFADIASWPWETAML